MLEAPSDFRGRQRPRKHAARAARRSPPTGQRLWKAMRVLQRFDVPQLMMAALVSRRSVRRYVRALEAQGIIRPDAPHAAPGHATTYVIARDPGPIAPLPSA